MQPAMKRIMSASLIAAAVRSSARREREPSKPVAHDGSEIGAAPLHQQEIALLYRSVPSAGLHQARVMADTMGKVNQAIERVAADASPDVEPFGAALELCHPEKMPPEEVRREVRLT
jgi:hypothetical protein